MIEQREVEINAVRVRCFAYDLESVHDIAIPLLRITRTIFIQTRNLPQTFVALDRYSVWKVELVLQGGSASIRIEMMISLMTS